MKAYDPETVGSNEAAGIIKPCDADCDKCGSDDIHRRYYAKGDEWPTGEFGEWPRRKATRELIDNHCRCCGYEWQCAPMEARDE